MSLSKTIRHKFLGIVSHAASARFMQAPARNFWIFPCPFHYSARRAQDLGAYLFRVFPHFQHILIPLEMDAGHGDTVRILHLRIEIHIIRVRPQRWGLNAKAYRSGIPPLDLTFEGRPKTIEMIRKPRKFSTPAIGIDRISANELLLVRIV